MPIALKRFALALVCLASAFASASQPDCSNLVGDWKNQLGSTLSIPGADFSTGKLTGTYTSPSGTSGQKYSLAGWVNQAAPASAPNVVPVLAFSVQWGNYGSITSWTGYCEVRNSVPTIVTVWNLAQPASKFRWDHILANSDLFTPAGP